MKLQATFLAIGLALVGNCAAAQGVPVQSGDHAGFTRLVARIGAEREWEIIREDSGVIIRFSPDAPDFDISRVFDMIARARLTEIRSEEGLHLDLACPCTVTIDRFQDQFAVIDIEDTPFVPATVPSATPPPTTSPVPDPVAAARPEPAANLPLFAGSRPATALPELAVLPEAPHHSDDTAVVTPRIDVTDAGNAVAEQMARATAAGLLNVAPGMPFESDDPIPTVPAHPPDGDHADTPTPGAPPVPDAPPLEMANAFDLRHKPRPGRLQPQPANSCITPPTRPAADWSDGMSFANGLGALRVGLYDDRGVLVEGRALLLAEFYLYHGFGAEAAFWLDQMAHAQPFHSGLATYLEYGTHGWLGDFDAHASCDEEVLFWLFLTGPGHDRPDAAASARILADFFNLPNTLRDLFGPTLARNFATLGNESAALEIRANIGRGGRLTRETLTLLDLDLAETAPGIAALNPALPAAPGHVSSVNAVTAMTHRLRAQIEARGHADADDLLAAEALILETDPRPDLNGLVHVTALANALAGNLDPIMQHLNATTGADASAAMPIFTDVADILMAQGQTAQLLILLSSPEFGQFGHFPSPAYRRQVADYFLAHGMPDLARDIIMAGGTDRTPDREILSAAFGRIARDLTAPVIIEAPLEDATSLPVAASSAEGIATLLQNSRDTRAAITALLNPPEPNS